jgi:beta-glucosidase
VPFTTTMPTAALSVIAEFLINDTNIMLLDFLPDGLTEPWTVKLSGKIKVPDMGPFDFGLIVAGK